MDKSISTRIYVWNGVPKDVLAISTSISSTTSSITASTSLFRLSDLALCMSARHSFILERVL
uniref:Uncharacterized protein n=1 Tax=Parascaris equorum TaxID=6256 RepID=A0A914RC25_PAREQ